MVGTHPNARCAPGGFAHPTHSQARRIHVSHPALSPNNVAVITGGASGIGFAAAMRFARLGLRICIADVEADRLSQAAAQLTAAAPEGAASVMTEVADVSKLDE